MNSRFSRGAFTYWWYVLATVTEARDLGPGVKSGRRGKVERSEVKRTRKPWGDRDVVYRSVASVNPRCPVTPPPSCCGPYHRQGRRTSERFLESTYGPARSSP